MPRALCSHMLDPLMRELIEAVKVWGYDKGIMGTDGAERQVLKAVSEMGEFADEVLKGDKPKQIMELGDVLVTLIISSHKLGFDIEEALAAAYKKISKRTGTTRAGIFIKD
jgi:NTP pyrophosphatase (non-canonical NTP hydrolase)